MLLAMSRAVWFQTWIIISGILTAVATVMCIRWLGGFCVRTACVSLMAAFVLALFFPLYWYTPLDLYSNLACWGATWSFCALVSRVEVAKFAEHFAWRMKNALVVLIAALGTWSLEFWQEHLGWYLRFGYTWEGAWEAIARDHTHRIPYLVGALIILVTILGMLCTRTPEEYRAAAEKKRSGWPAIFARAAYYLFATLLVLFLARFFCTPIYGVCLAVWQYLCG